MPNFNAKEEIFKKKRKITVSWVVLNTLFFAIAVAGTCYKVEAAANFIMFFTVVLCIFTLTALIVSFTPPGRFTFLDKHLPPEILEKTYDVVVLVLFVSHGWFWTAGFYLFHILTVFAYRNNMDKPVDPETRAKAMLSYYGSKVQIEEADRLPYLLADLRSITPAPKFIEALKKAEEFYIGEQK